MSDLESLQEQIIAWQERRFTVVTGAMTLVTVLCGFILSDGKQSWTREQAGILICIILFCATLFSWYAGWQNSIIGEFISSLREADSSVLGWETAAKALRARGDFSASVSLNKIIAFTFLVTALGTNAIFYLHCQRDGKKIARHIYLAAAAALLFALIVLAFPRYFLPNYEKVWQEIRADHSRRHSQPTTPKQ